MCIVLRNLGFALFHSPQICKEVEDRFQLLGWLVCTCLRSCLVAVTAKCHKNLPKWAIKSPPVEAFNQAHQKECVRTPSPGPAKTSGWRQRRGIVPGHVSWESKGPPPSATPPFQPPANDIGNGNDSGTMMVCFLTHLSKANCFLAGF